ncbi:hypothetical protein Adt_14679 [Abeliophyllum distichum]|uniref:Uncharacterized protein n=1 Tax=Abeliophyllum distichum TaxID=126358 RepID=A0ABD1U0A3_9LAMI
MGSQNGLIFRRRRGAALDIWAELVAPTESTRLFGSTLYVFAYQGPVPSPVLVYKSGQDLVLFSTPGPLILFEQFKFLVVLFPENEDSYESESIEEELTDEERFNASIFKRKTNIEKKKNI